MQDTASDHKLDPKIYELARGRNFAALTTMLPDGHPQTQVMWIDADEDHLMVNTEVHRQKFRNVERDPRVTVRRGTRGSRGEGEGAGSERAHRLAFAEVPRQTLWD